MKTCNFHRFLYKYGFKIYCDKMVIKLLFYKRAEFFYSAAESFGHSGRKMLKRVGNTGVRSCSVLHSCHPDNILYCKGTS